MIDETIAQYTIIEKLGSGGMGEVYLAQDTKLDRRVALKFLPEHLALEGDVKARFLQEARAAAAFTHPNVCAVYDVQELDNRMFIVMEYVDGQTLRDKKDTLSVTQIVEIIAQVADGLAAAHQQGIVHRDIKSENIMLRKDGIAQITDFGLAKLRGVTSRLTKEGSTLGTTGYMSPEQALGQDVDHRSDIFSLGVVLFELLTGEMPFTGAHEAAIMYEIVNVEAAPPTAINPDLDPEIDRIILECLQKEPDERYQSAREVAKDLRRFKRDSGRKRVSRISQSRVTPSRAPVRRVSTAPHSVVESRAPEPVGRSRSSWIPWIVAVALAATSGLLAFLLMTSSNRESHLPIRFSIEPPSDNTITLVEAGNVAISPNGRLIAFTAIDGKGVRHLWIRSIDAFDARPLTGTEGASYPFWSPDSRFVGFFGDAKLKKIDVTGGPPLSLCDAPAGRAGTWNAEGVIIFAPDQSGWLHKVAAAGGPSEQVTVPDSTRSELTHRWPWFLPDGNRFLYYSRSGGGGTADAVVLSSLDGSVHRTLLYNNGNAAFANGHLIFVRENVLMAQPFDLNTDTLFGIPFPIAEGAHFNGRFNSAEFSVSQSGAVVYLAGGSSVRRVILHLNDQGQIIDTIGKPDNYVNCRLSPDGSHLLVSIIDEEVSNSDLWTIDLNRRITSRITFDSVSQFQFAWSPNGEYIAYSSFSPDRNKVYTQPISGVGTTQLILDTNVMIRPTDWSHDGRYLLCRSRKDNATDDMAIAIPVEPDGTRRNTDILILGDTISDVDVGSFSPDGRWFTYASRETGRMEIYVRRFPGPSAKYQISADGGDLPVWSADGKHIYFANDAGDAIMNADVDGSGSSLVVGAVHPQVRYRMSGGILPFDVSSQGLEFYLVADEDAASDEKFNVILNWDAEITDK